MIMKVFAKLFVTLLVLSVAFTLSSSDSGTDEGCPKKDPEDGSKILLANPENCATYFSCSKGVPILMHCPDGLHFNDRLDVCDWPQNAGCSCAACCDPDCTDCVKIKKLGIRCLANPSCYNARFTVKTCPRDMP